MSSRGKILVGKCLEKSPSEKCAVGELSSGKRSVGKLSSWGAVRLQDTTDFKTLLFHNASKKVLLLFKESNKVQILTRNSKLF